MPQRIHSQIDTHNAHQAHFHSEKLSEHTTLLESIATNTENINVNVGDVEINVADMEVLQTATNSKLDTINTTLTAGGVVDISTLSTHAKQTDIHNRQDDILTASNASKLSVASLDTNFSAHKTANNTHLQNIYNRQDSQLIPLNAIALSSTTTATKISALESANHTDLGNIFSRQDDILTSNNASKLSNATIATKMTSLESTNHTDLNNIYTRQDDILTSNNASKLSNATIATKITSLESANHTDLNNIFSRQDDILTSCNAVKTNTQSLEDCVASNKVNVNISSGIGDLATESTLQTIAEFNCDTTDVTISSSALPSGAATQSTLNDAEVHLGSIDGKIALCNTGSVIIAASALPSGAATSALQAGGLPSALSSDNLKVSLKESIAVGVTNGPLTNLDATINSNRIDVNIAAGNISGFATATLQAGGLPSALSSDNLKVSIKETIDLPITNGALTELAAAINSDKVDVNISSGGFNGVVSGTVTANLSTTDNAVLDEIQTNGDNIQTKLDTMDSQIDLLEGANTIKDVSWLSSVSLSASSLSANLDTEGYKELTLYGKTTADHGSNLHIFGSSGDGVYFHISTLATSTVGGAYYIKEDTPLNLPNPRYFKIYNADSSTATITLRATLTDKRRYV